MNTNKIAAQTNQRLNSFEIEIRGRLEQLLKEQAAMSEMFVIAQNCVLQRYLATIQQIKQYLADHHEVHFAVTTAEILTRFLINASPADLETLDSQIADLQTKRLLRRVCQPA